MGAPDHRSNWYVLIPALLAFAVFITYFLQIRGQPFVTHLVANPLVYDDQAGQILRATPPSQPFFLSPLYPALVAIVYFFTHGSVASVMVCQGILLAVNVWLLGSIAGSVMGRSAALAASLVMVFYWSFYYFAGELVPATLFLTFLLTGVYLFVRKDEQGLAPLAVTMLGFAGILFAVRAVPGLANMPVLLGRGDPTAPASAYRATVVFFLVFAAGVGILLAAAARIGRLASGKNLLVSGLILGTSLLVWSGSALLVAALAVKTLLARECSRLKPALFILAIAVPLMAGLAHNYLISGRIILATSSFGVNLFIGNNADSDGMNPFSFGKGDRVRIEADRRALAGADRSAFFRNGALEFIKSDPAAWLRLVGRKLLIAVAGTEVDNNADISERRSAWTRLFLPRLHFGLVFPLAVIGIVQALSVRRESLILVLGYATFVGVETVFFACERFRLPAVAFMILLAMIGIERLVQDIRRRHLSKVALWVVLMAGAAVISNADPLGIADTEFASITVNRAHVQRLEGNLEQARALIAVALSEEPDNAGAYFQLGAIEEQEGNLRQAARHFMTSLEMDPYYYGSYAGMKRVLDQARISATYLDSYVDNLIHMRDQAGARARLIKFIEERLP